MESTEARKNELVSGEGAAIGDDVIVTKWIGIEGTCKIARRKEEELVRHFNPSFIRGAKELAKFLPVEKDAKTALRSEVHSMHCIAECGIFGALWEMAEEARAGLNIQIKDIPIRQETVEICEFYRINPYWLLSKGALLITAPNGGGIVSELNKEGISAAVIGRITAGNDRLLFNGEGRRYLEPPKGDEIYKVIPQCGLIMQEF